MYAHALYHAHMCYAELFLTVAFVVEVLLRLYAMGPTAYLQSSLCQLDLAVRLRVKCFRCLPHLVRTVPLHRVCRVLPLGYCPFLLALRAYFHM